MKFKQDLTVIRNISHFALFIVTTCTLYVIKIFLIMLLHLHLESEVNGRILVSLTTERQIVDKSVSPTLD